MDSDLHLFNEKPAHCLLRPVGQLPGWQNASPCKDGNTFKDAARGHLSHTAKPFASRRNGCCIPMQRSDRGASGLARLATFAWES